MAAPSDDKIGMSFRIGPELPPPLQGGLYHRRLASQGGTLGWYARTPLAWRMSKLRSPALAGARCWYAKVHGPNVPAKAKGGSPRSVTADCGLTARHAQPGHRSTASAARRKAGAMAASGRLEDSERWLKRTAQLRPSEPRTSSVEVPGRLPLWE